MFTLKGTPVNVWNLKRDIVYKNDEMYNLMRALGCGAASAQRQMLNAVYEIFRLRTFRDEFEVLNAAAKS